MSKKKTQITELSLACGLLDLKVNSESIKKVQNVSLEINANVCKLLKDEKLSKLSTRFHSIGKKLRDYLIQSGTNPVSVKWTGPEAIGSASTAAKDLEINGIWKVSVKEDSNIVINGSPERIFEHLPKGIKNRDSRSQNWFLKIAPEEINEYFLICGGFEQTGVNSANEYFSRKVKSQIKKNFSEHVKSLHDNANKEVLDAYAKLCRKVSAESARIFNERFEETKKSRTSKAVIKSIFHEFFRVNGSRYILAGSDKNKDFAVILAPSDVWEKKYKFLDIKAKPIKAGQPEVEFEFTFQKQDDNTIFTKKLKAEIRWSHGKFCGNPESKLYKTWKYSELEWVSCDAMDLTQDSESSIMLFNSEAAVN